MNHDRLRSPTPFHIGTVVSDLDEAIALHETLGIRSWSKAAWASSDYFDAGHGHAITVRKRVSFGRLSDDMSLELIEVDRTSSVPEVWDVESGGPVTHIGYWSANPTRDAQKIIDAGGELLLARGFSDEILKAAPAVRGTWMPERLDTCYLSSGTGLHIEFLPEYAWEQRMPALLGDQRDRLITGPRAAETGEPRDG